jgi:2-dehydropantoate 2-reductase
MIVIVGTGALATLFAARLARHTPLTLLGTWSEAITAINHHGLQVEGESESIRVKATADSADCAGASLALVLVKAWQTERAALQISQFLAPNGLALSLQNGLGNFEALAAELGADRVALGTTTLAATLLGPGQVRDASSSQSLTSLARHPQLNLFAQLLQTAGLRTDTVEADQLQSLIWGKLVVNCAINPLTALLRVPNGELLQRPDALALMESAAHEAAAVAVAKKIQLPFSDPAARARQVAQATAANRSSMFQDILRGAMTEIEAINGAVVNAGAKAGVATPVNTTLYRLVKALGPS